MPGFGRGWIAVGAGLVALAIPASASAAIQLGETFVPATDSGCAGPPHTYLQTGTPPAPAPQYAAPFGGVITAWSFQAHPSAPTTLELKVGRRIGMSDDFFIVGESPEKTVAAGSTATFTDVRIPVEVGDVIGTFVSSGRCYREAAGYSWHMREGDAQPGTTTTFTSFAPRQLAIAAMLEPDCDSDGFGDETQDPELPPTQACDPNPPNATITKGPPPKTRKARVTFEFTGTDTRAIASFQCKLDAGAFAACTSPYKVRVKKGKHRFQVQAIDQAGNVGAPATDTWKRKKKRKK